MDRTSQHSSSTRASHNNHFIRRGGHNSKIHPTRYGKMRRNIFRRPRTNNNVRDILVQFNGTNNMQTAFLMMSAGHFSPRHAVRVPAQPLGSRYSSQISNVIPTPFAGGVTGVQISESSRVGNINPQPPGSGSHVPFTGVQTPSAAARGSSRAGYHQQTQNAGTSLSDFGGRGSSRAGYHQPTQNAGTFLPDFGGQNVAPGPDIVPEAPFLHTNIHTHVAGPEYQRDWLYSQVPGVGLGSFLHHGGFTGGYSPWGPGPSLTPQAYVDGLTTLQAPFLPAYDTQAAPPPYLGQQLPPQFPDTATTTASTGEFVPPATLAHQQLFPPLWASTTANNAYNG